MLVTAMGMAQDGSPLGHLGGLVIGTWGAVQATAAGLAIALGGIIRDVIASQSTPVMGYTAVYALEVLLLIATIVAMVPLLRRNPSR